ncbi:MAG: alpha/beta hydrolase [Clostridia bacterium]|nr:alpha/beta hydrolase [Oscillospiraceae bacterium]MBP3588484.1 alpha/beta hydrolase [Clostridia bacterium]
MSLQGLLFQLSASVSDYKRDRVIPLPAGVSQCRNITYGSHGKWNILDVYHPDHTTGPLPTIVSIHGGGYVYGSKEIYRRYGMDMASRGFAFVNFNYRLAPKWRFPTPLWDTNTVMEWICKNAARYRLDPEHIILVGDSAGAQLASQYAAIVTNPEYAAKFHMTVPKIRIRALGLNCGFYDFPADATKTLTGLARDYLGPRPDYSHPLLQVLPAITSDYPPTYITTACEDYLRAYAEPMYEHLRSKEIDAQWKCYGTEGDTSVAHVFHVNITHPEAVRCNDDAAAFFRQYL